MVERHKAIVEHPLVHGLKGGRVEQLLERRDLGEAGRVYIRERLALGKTLSTLLQRVDFTNGDAWTELPPWATDEQARQFSDCAWSVTGSYLTDDLTVRTDLPSRFDATVERVLRLLHEQEHGVALWEDAQAESSDRWIKEHPEEPVRFLGEEVYYVLTHKTAHEGTVAGGLGTMVAWWGSPAVVATPPAEVVTGLRPRSVLTRDQLQALVDHLRLVYFQAYDGLAYVLWAPTARAAGHDEQ